MNTNNETTIKDLSGDYQKGTNETFNVDGDQWQICKKGKTQKYLFNVTRNKYISGLFKIKGNDDDSIRSFDYGGNYYFFTIEGDSVIIMFVEEKKKNK